jgi:phage protein D
MVDFKIEVNGKDVTSSVMNHLEEFQIVDKDGKESDELTLKVYNQIVRPKYEDKIKVWLNSLYYGAFIVQQTTVNSENELTITATATNFNGNLKTTKSKTFINKTLKEIVETSATEANYSVKSDFADVRIERLLRQKESLLHFLSRLAKSYDAVFSVKNDMVLFLDRESKKEAISIYVNDCASWEITYVNRKRYDGVTAVWRDTKHNKQMSVLVGKKGDAMHTIKGKYKNSTDAKLKAKAVLNRAKRGLKEGTLTKMGEYIPAGGKINLIGTLEDDGVYNVKSVTHDITHNNGYVVTIEFEN